MHRRFAIALGHSIWIVTDGNKILGHLQRARIIFPRRSEVLHLDSTRRTSGSISGSSRLPSLYSDRPQTRREDATDQDRYTSQATTTGVAPCQSRDPEPILESPLHDRIRFRTWLRSCRADSSRQSTLRPGSPVVKNGPVVERSDGGPNSCGFFIDVGSAPRSEICRQS